MLAISKATCDTRHATLMRYSGCGCANAEIAVPARYGAHRNGRIAINVMQHLPKANKIAGLASLVGTAPVRPLHESKNPMPAPVADARYGVLLIGFSDLERTLFTSLFKVSGAYREWKSEMEGKPDCILLDLETEPARLWYERVDQEPLDRPIVAVGYDAQGSSIADTPTTDTRITDTRITATRITATRITATRIAATLTRPLRWSGILTTLESVIANSRHNGDVPSREPATLAAVPEPDVTPKPATPRKYKTIATALIVNPNPKGWRYITGELAARGYRVDHVSTGEAAVLLLANFRYNAVFVEMLLPDEDGVAICRMLKQSLGRRKVTTIILSTKRKAVDRIRGTFVGCDAFLSAPVDADELQRTLDRLVPEYILDSEK
jgi:CheY-like chemotaxis protein